MGAKVEGESYKPGYYATGDLQMDTNGWRSPYYEDMTSNGQLYSGFMTKQADDYSEYDNERLKRTMLKHDAMFRQQVYELHRVYKIQRDLMIHCQNKEIYAYPIVADASQTNSPSQVPPNGAKMIWDMQMPLSAAVAEHNDTNHSLKFLSGGRVSSSLNGFPSRGGALNTKHGTIDLELPADHYVDDGDASDNKPIDFLGVESDKKSQNGADVTLGSIQGLGRFSENEPITHMHMGQMNGSVCRELPYTLENSWHKSVCRSSATNFGFNKECYKDKHTDEGTSSNFFEGSAKIRLEEKPLINKGKHVSNRTLTTRYSDADPQNSYTTTDGRSVINDHFVCQGQNTSVGWFSRSHTEVAATNHSTLGIHVAPIPVSHIDHPFVASPIGSCTLDPRSSTINTAVFRSIPSFNGSSTVNSYTSPVVTQSMGTSIHKLKRFDNLESNYFGIPHDPFSSSRSQQQITISSELEQNNSLMIQHLPQQSDVDPQFSNGKGTKNFNLNEALSDGQEELIEQDGRCVGSLLHSKGDGIPLLKNKATCIDVAGLEKPSNGLGHSNGIALDIKNSKDMTGTSLVCNFSDSASTFLGCGMKDELITARTRMICNKAEESTTYLPLSCQKLLARDGQASEGVMKKSCASIRNLIDLNDDAPNEDNSESSVVSHECNVSSLQNNHAVRKIVIDLEVPACEDSVAWTNRMEYTPSKLDASREPDLYFMSTTVAAHNILALSMDVPTIAGTPDDMLQWFAGLALSSVDVHVEQAEVQGCINNSSDDDLDSFESLTLKLEETKTSEYWTRPIAPTLTNDEQTVSAVNLLSRPKRGQQRRRRQKLDFQKDILPGLSSLSRPNIIEDIQLIEGLIQASGGSWESSLSRRARGGRKRGRNSCKNLPVIVEKEADVTPPPKPDSVGLEADEKGMIGWGRTTRRCRKPRCPSGNNITTC